ncbi:MAG TPA: hypothetical protein VJK04_00935 [Candidatus Paceibacterota bacterium]|uniref:Uncharacterized protein n=1 Tax=Candidatus Liptonbacteria bacterium RIFCSPLOWO2_01_FULL_45_15 TaxID=1798649 RepID=A0A1G2CGD1_9BACT|nr:MAG: hypothetical protein A3B13_02925 [Candidatus Liptonbacteria bacterium RIFCSPLOWO2_01_FULL_45_15]
MDQIDNNFEHISGANVPPPPAEVGVRTMASDLASIAERGGGSPKPRMIKISSVSASPHVVHPAISPAVVHSAAVSPVADETQNPAPGSKSLFSKPTFLFPFLGILLLGVFSAAYFLVYPLLNPKKPSVKVPIVPTVKQSLSFEHESFFGQPIDGNFTLEILSPIIGMESERDRISSFVNGITGSFFEIIPQSGDGQAFSADDFFSSIGGNVLDPDFLNENFEKDFTLFLYKDKSGLWLGYILQLKTGKSPIFLQKAVLQKMESASTERANLFLASPGVQTDSKFQNGLSGGQPIWFMNFSNTSSVLAYGWFFNKYLAISTSFEGLKQAILHF